jgi:hypothetical protein
MGINMAQIIPDEELDKVMNSNVYSNALKELCVTGDWNKYYRSKIAELKGSCRTYSIFLTILTVAIVTLPHELLWLLLLFILLEALLLYMIFFSSMNIYVYTRSLEDPSYREPRWFTRMYGGIPIDDR